MWKLSASVPLCFFGTSGLAISSSSMAVVDAIMALLDFDMADMDARFEK